MTQVVAITAPTSGTGRAQARAYAAAGWDVALIGRGWAGLEAAAADVRAAGREALVVPIDLTDPAARALAIQRIGRELGPIDAWVADGAVPRHGPPIRPSVPPSRRQVFAWRASAGLARVRRAPTATTLGIAGAGVAGAAVLAAIAVGRLARRT
jgi:NAD(P)-dependent dehydrogenase (short-subunit alcohol dehydrogenase family)